MSKFLKGDRVRRSLDAGYWYSIKPGDVAIVSKDQRDNILELEGHSGVHFRAHNFELVRPATPPKTGFVVGDRVRRRDDAGQSANCKPGGIYTVNCVKPDGNGGFDIGTDADDWGTTPRHFARNFELVSRPDKAPAKPPVADTPATRAAFAGYTPNIGHTKDGGGLQQHSIGGPFPFVLVGIDNPTGLEPGLYWYVQDKAGNRCTIHIKSCERAGKLAAHLSTIYPGGINTLSRGATPPLSSSEGYIKPKPATVTVKLARTDAEAFPAPHLWSQEQDRRIAAAIKAAL